MAKKATRRTPAKKTAGKKTKTPSTKSKNFDNELRGALFKNRNRETDAHPQYTGSAKIDGLEYWISAWVQKSKAGQPYMSLAFTLKEGQERAVVEENFF